MSEKNITLSIILQALGEKDARLTKSSQDVFYHLKQQGFTDEHITTAAQWIMQLIQQQFLSATSAPIPNSLRVFTAEENKKLDVQCRSFILSLERLQILTPKTREILINQLLLLNQEHINLNDVKLVTLLVLLLQPSSAEKIQKLELFALELRNKQN